MERHLQIAVECLARFFAAGQQQSGHLVFVLVGQQLVIPLGDRLLQLAILDILQHPAIAFGQPLALVGQQMLGAIGDLLVQRLGQLDHVGRQQLAGLPRVQHRPAPDIKGPQVLAHRRAVQLDRLGDRLKTDRDQPALPGAAEHHHVGIDRIAHRDPRQLRGIEQRQVLLEPRLQRQRQPVGGNGELGVAGEIAGDDLVAVDHRAAAPGRHQSQGLGPGADHQVAADQRISLAGGHADRADILGFLGDATMDVHRAALLRQPGHLHHAGALAVDLRRLR